MVKNRTLLRIRTCVYSSSVVQLIYAHAYKQIEVIYMSKKLHACKTCGKEIAKNAKVCPYCGAKNKGKHPILIIILLLLALFIIIDSSSSEEPSKVDNPSPTQVSNSVSDAATEIQETEEDARVFVGETAELNDVLVTFVGATINNGSTYNIPTDGNVFVLCEFEVVNNSDHEISISSMLSFEAYCDDYTCTYSLAALMEKGNKNQLDGTVAPGKKFNGVIGYEVPSDWKELEIHFTPDTWSFRDIIFVATNE